jgi:CBS domain-containing protein
VISYAEDFVRDTLSHVQVCELMHDEPAAVSRSMSVSTFLASAMILPHQRTLPVVDDDNLLGFVRLADAATIPEEDWCRTPVGEIMIPASEIPMLSATDDADLALQLLVRQPVEQLPVVERGRVLGFVHRWDIMHWLIKHDVPA